MDLVEILTNTNNGVSSQIFNENEVNDAENWLNNHPVVVRLDLHGVVDILDVDTPLPESCCIVSFVGKFSKTRSYAREEIVNRINSGQIDFGILVFKRGKGRNRNFFNEVGSKAWVNKCLPRKRNVKNIFIDDSYDHYISVKKNRIRWLYSYHFKGKTSDELLEMIEKIGTF